MSISVLMQGRTFLEFLQAWWTSGLLKIAYDLFSQSEAPFFFFNNCSPDICSVYLQVVCEKVEGKQDLSQGQDSSPDSALPIT